MYADARHLLQTFEVGIIAFGAIALFRESGCNMDARKWPKHIGDDFASTDINQDQMNQKRNESR